MSITYLMYIYIQLIWFNDVLFFKIWYSSPLLSSPLQAFLHMIILSITSATGQLFIFYTIKEFGPVQFTIIMTSRQILSLVISCFWFGHTLHFIGWVSTIVVFAVVVYRIYVGRFDWFTFEDLTDLRLKIWLIYVGRFDWFTLVDLADLRWKNWLIYVGRFNWFTMEELTDLRWKIWLI